MRLSCLESDPGHAAYCSLIGKRGRPQVIARVDGVEIPHVRTVDLDEGYVLAFAVDGDGKPYVDAKTRDVATVEHRGVVEIVLRRGRA